MNFIVFFRHRGFRQIWHRTTWILRLNFERLNFLNLRRRNFYSPNSWNYFLNFCNLNFWKIHFYQNFCIRNSWRYFYPNSYSRNSWNYFLNFCNPNFLLHFQMIWNRQNSLGLSPCRYPCSMTVLLKCFHFCRYCFSVQYFDKTDCSWSYCYILDTNVYSCLFCMICSVLWHPHSQNAVMLYYHDTCLNFCCPGYSLRY